MMDIRPGRRLALLLSMVLLVCAAIPATALGQTSEPAAEPAPYAALADILENERTREQLIAELRRLAEPGQAADAAAPGDAGPQPGADAAPAGERISLPRQIAKTTAALAEGAVAGMNRIVAAIGALRRPATGPGPDLATLGPLLVNLAVLIVGTVVLFLVLRRLARPLFAQAGRWARNRGRSRGAGNFTVPRLIAIIWSGAIDLVVIALAAIGGYAIALFGMGSPGGIDASATLFLNAFVLVEVFKAVLRMVFAARYDDLRLFPMPADVAEYWNAWLARLSGFIGYGLLFVVPIVNLNVSPALSQLTGLVVMVAAYVYALVVILRNRAILRARLEARADHASLGLTKALLRALAGTWHLWAIAYFTVLLVVSQLYPEEALPFMMLATVQTLAAIGGGLLLSAIVTRVVSGPPRRADRRPNRRLAPLRRQLDTYVPTVLRVVRAVIAVAVVLVVIDAWHLFDLGGWLASEAGGRTVATAVDVAIILVVALLLWVAVAGVIEHRLSPDTGGGMPTAREMTLLALFRNAVAIVIITITLMVVLSEIGIDIGPLLASAGVLGLAIGFGAQKMVQDVITGVFIQLENAMNTGDVVTLAGVTGTAERLSIRSVGVRDLAGTYHLIPFSSVGVVSNYMRDFAYHWGEYRISYREDVDDAIAHLRAAFDELAADETQARELLGPLEVYGVSALAENHVSIRILIKTRPGSQWSVGRAYNGLVKKHFDAAGIEIPVAQRTLHFGENKEGEAPPARVHLSQPVLGAVPREGAGGSEDRTAGGPPATRAGDDKARE